MVKKIFKTFLKSLTRIIKLFVLDNMIFELKGMSWLLQELL